MKWGSYTYNLFPSGVWVSFSFSLCAIIYYSEPERERVGWGIVAEDDADNDDLRNACLCTTAFNYPLLFK